MTDAQIIAAGWEQTKIDHTTTTMDKSRASYKKDNYFLIVYRRSKDPFPVIYIMPNDPIKECWYLWPEQFRIVMPCPTIELLNNIYDALIKGKQEINLDE